MTIAGAVYRDGIARTTDGAVYMSDLGASTAMPATAVAANGAGISPSSMKLTTDGAIYVRVR